MLILYNIFLFDLLFNEGILNKPGNKQVKNGVIKEIAKLDNTSFNRCICVFLYTAQKHPI